MPNWCYNRLCIDTTTEGGKILAAAFKPSKVDDRGNLYSTPFQDLRPCPEDLHITATCGNGIDPELQKKYDANIEKYGFAHWYEWCWKNWGVKWDARVEDYDDSDPESTYVYFETPWGAPIEFFRHFSDEHPDAR